MRPLPPKGRRLSPTDVIKRLKARADYDPVMLIAGIKVPKGKPKRQYSPAGKAKLVAAWIKRKHAANRTYGLATAQGDLNRLGFLRGRTVRG